MTNEARDNLARALRRTRRYGAVMVVAGAIGAATVLGGFGVAVALLGGAMVLGAAFAKGYYLED